MSSTLLHLQTIDDLWDAAEGYFMEMDQCRCVGEVERTEVWRERDQLEARMKLLRDHVCKS